MGILCIPDSFSVACVKTLASVFALQIHSVSHFLHFLLFAKSNIFFLFPIQSESEPSTSYSDAEIQRGACLMAKNDSTKAIETR